MGTQKGVIMTPDCVRAPCEEQMLTKLCSIARNLFGVYDVLASKNVSKRKKLFISDLDTQSFGATYSYIFTP